MEIDCPSDCTYLQSGREYESRKPLRSGPVLPRTERLWQNDFIQAHSWIFVEMWRVLVESRQRLPEIVDADLQAALEALIQTYRTMEKGIYYESLPSQTYSRELYFGLKSVLESDDQESGLHRLKTGTILDCLTFHKEMGEAVTLPRPRSRAFLDHLQEMYCKTTEGSKTKAGIILP